MTFHVVLLGVNISFHALCTLRARVAWGASSGAALLLTLRLTFGWGHPFYLKNTLECGPLRARTASHQLNGHKARKDVLIPKHAHFFGTICSTRRPISLKQADNLAPLAVSGATQVKVTPLVTKQKRKKGPLFEGLFPPKKRVFWGKQRSR